MSATNTVAGVVAAEETGARARVTALGFITAAYGLGAGLFFGPRGRVFMVEQQPRVADDQRCACLGLLIESTLPHRKVHEALAFLLSCPRRRPRSAW